MQDTSGGINTYTLKFLYERYKDFVIPFVMVIVSILLFSRIVLPSVFDLLDTREKQKTVAQALTNIENKLGILRGIDESELDSRLRIVAKTLPIDKDFEGILYAISDAAGRSGISIENFKFAVGDLSEEEGETREGREFPSLEVELKLKGSAYEVNNFIERLQRTAPISEVNKISAQETSSAVKVDFYYKRLTRTKLDDSIPLPPSSDKESQLINELSSAFYFPPLSIFELDPTATTSSVVNPNPFQ